MEKDETKAYSECCNMIRHYSNASFNVRILCFVQGLALFATWAIYFQKQNFCLAICLSIGGILFTLLSYLFHSGYYDTAGKFYELAETLESKMFSEEHQIFKLFNQYHKIKYQRLNSDYLVIKAPFTFIGLLFFVAMLFSIYRDLH